MVVQKLPDRTECGKQHGNINDAIVSNHATVTERSMEKEGGVIEQANGGIKCHSFKVE